MKIITFSISDYITADTTLITADNTLITADATGMFGDSIIRIIPREMVDSVYVILYNELTFVEFKFNVPATNDRGYLKFALSTAGIEEGDSFELTVRKDSYDGTLIYRGKAYATVVEDLANYKLNYPNASGVIIVN